jgi:hypothetical protein
VLFKKGIMFREVTKYPEISTDYRGILTKGHEIQIIKDESMNLIDPFWPPLCDCCVCFL